MKTKKLKIIVKKSKEKGSMLLEALIGILIFSFGIMGLALFQGVTIANNIENSFRAEASMYVNVLIGKMWASPDTLQSFSADNQLVPATETNLVDPRKTVVVNGNQVTINFSWKRPNDKKRAHMTVVTKITPNN